MQNRPNDTRTVILLIVGIVFFLGFGIWRIVTVTNAAAPKVTTTMATTNPPAGGTAPNVQLASAANPAQEPQVGPGQVRVLSPVLDAPPAPGQMLPPPRPRSDAFVPFPPASQEKPKPAVSASNAGTPAGSRGAAGGNGGQPLPDWVRGQPLFTAPPTPVMLTDIKLDGVITGPEGFAMLTVHEPGSGNTAMAEQYVYKRVGEKIGNDEIASLSDTGITLKKRPITWMVGQTLRFRIPVPNAVSASANPTAMTTPRRTNASAVTAVDAPVIVVPEPNR